MRDEDDYDYRAPAIICAVIAGGLLVFAVVTSLISWAEGANIGGGLAVLISIPFAAMAGHYWVKPPPGPRR